MATGIQSGLRVSPPPDQTWWQRSHQYWTGRTRSQRLWVVATISLLLIAGLTAQVLVTAHAPQPLFSFTIAEPDRQQITSLLTRHGYRYELLGDKIMVPPEDRQRVADWLAVDYNLPHGMAATPPPGSSNPFLPQGNSIQDQAQAREHQIAEHLRSLSFVRDCTVSLVLADPESQLMGQNCPCTAAIELDFRPGQRPDSSQIEGIVGQVVASVPGLTGDHLRLVDQNAVDLYRPRAASGEHATTEKKLELERALTDKLRPQLDCEFGPSHYTLAIDVDLEEETRTIRSTELGPPQLEQSQTTDENYNTADKPAPLPSSEDVSLGCFTPPHVGYKRRSAKVKNVQGQVERLVTVPPGGIRRLCATLAIDRPLSAAQISTYRESLENAIGINESRGDQINVRSATFYQPAGSVSAAPVTPAAGVEPIHLPSMWFAPLLAIMASGAGLVWAGRPSTARPDIKLQRAHPTNPMVDMDLVDLHRPKGGTSTATNPRRSLEDLAHRDPQHVAHHLLKTWLHPEI